MPRCVFSSRSSLADIGQVSLALVMGYHLSMLLWKWDYDPDVYALPLLSSSIDCIGQLMLVGAFTFARARAGGKTGNPAG